MRAEKTVIPSTITGDTITVRQDHGEKSVFKPENLIAAALAQKGLARESVPGTCILDPDGDIVRYLVRRGEARKSESWPCYHSDLHLFRRDGLEFGIIGCAVGAPYAVLVSEELFVLGCRRVISITSAGLLEPSIETPCFMLIGESIRDEGTSDHYLPATETVTLAPKLRGVLGGLLNEKGIISGLAWTTDAPFRETASRIAAMRDRGAIAVEMESAALYAFAEARQKDVICFAHITNQMGTVSNDFDKGEENGSERALELIATVTRLVQGA